VPLPDTDEISGGKRFKGAGCSAHAVCNGAGSLGQSRRFFKSEEFGEGK